MADILNQNGLSIGAFNMPPMNPAVPSIVAEGDRPADVIGRASTLMHSVGMLQYPQDMAKYYMGFTIYKYSRESLMAVGLTEMLNQIAMPLPDQMLDINQVAFDQREFSSTIGNATNAGMPLVKKIQNNVGSDKSPLDGMGKSDFAPFLTDVTVGAGIDSVSALTGEQGKAIMGAAGYSPNYFLTVVLNGPRYKQHTFSWTCAPRTPQEAVQLTQIIRVFKDAQAPGLALGGALFSFPRVFMNYFAPNRGHLYQFKPAVLINFTVNYAPAGFPAMKQGRPELNNWNTVSAMRISATFLELEFWLRSDFGDAGPAAQGNQDKANEIRPTPGSGRNAP